MFQLHLEEPLNRKFTGESGFDAIINLRGRVFREKEGRRTQRCTIDGRTYFVKSHYGVGWFEILKNLLYGRFPVLGARVEWQAIQRLRSLGVDSLTIRGFGERGNNPAKRQSFLITDELEAMVSLEQYCIRRTLDCWTRRQRRVVIHKIARIAATLHENGMNHRDFYLAHFLFRAEELDDANPERLRLYLIDLHRVQMRRRTPRRWLVKDLGGLMFSAMDVGLTRGDCLRFLRAYCNRPLREILRREGSFWKAVVRKAVRLYQKHSTSPVAPGLQWALEYCECARTTNEPSTAA